ncbi:MAG: glycoside hydrolase domain-containing protein [Gemmatimonadaceae bacterium]
MTNPLRFALLLVLASGCARVATTRPRPVTQSFAGFDVAIYPGEAAMRAWLRPNSPYYWVGYYLPAPCHRDTSWAGKRATLAGMGWGLAVLYVGQQAWEGVPERVAAADTARPAGDTAGAAAGVQRNIVCSRTLLTAAQGLAEANDAITKASADGFPRGTHIFLDIERMTTIPQAMRDYYRAWVARVLADGRFRPAIYAHQRNAAEIYGDVRATFDAAGVRDEPSFWVSSPAAATLTSSPSEVGFRFARVWQHALDASQTFNGVTLRRIDANVSDSPSPSAAGPVIANSGQSAARGPAGAPPGLVTVSP